MGIKTVNHWMVLLLILAIVSRVHAKEMGHDHQSLEEDEILSDEVLEEKQQTYLREGSRDLQDDPTQYCSSLMEVNPVNGIATSEVRIVYPVSTGYPNNLRRCVIFKPTQDIFLEVTITFLNTELNFDFVEVYPIGSYDVANLLVSNVGARLVQWSGTDLPTENSRKAVAKAGETIMIVLRTDGNRNIWTGFQASVESKYRDCFSGMTFIQAVPLPQVFSDGFVSQYPPNYAYCWVVAPPRGEHVQVVFTAMNTELNVDIVEVSTIQSFDMQRQTYTGKRLPPWGSFSGLNIPPTIDANNNEIILISFRSDSTLQFPGFSGRISAPGPVPTGAPTKRPTHVDCESNVDLYIAPEASEGQTIEDGLQSYYLDSAFCYVLTPASASTFVSVEFLDLSLINSDELEIWALRQPVSTNYQDRLPGQLALATRTTTLPWFYSGQMGQSIVLQLKTDRAQTSARFRARIRSNAAATVAPTLAPTAAECTNGMQEYEAPAPGGELVFDDNDDGFYPNNYQYCAVLKGVPGYRLIISFDEILIQDDHIEVSSVRTYNLDTKRYTGRTLLRRIDAASIAKNVSTTITTKSELPTLVSFRTNFGRNGRGFRARARMVAASEITSAPVIPSPSPTFIATESPTTLPRCTTKMTVIRMKETTLSFTDGLRAVPRGKMYCWVLVPFNERSFTQLDFTGVGLGTGATLEIGPIRSYNAKKRTYDGYTRRVSILSKGAQYEGRPGTSLLLMLTTDRIGKRTGGFSANAVAPCFCPMYESADRCKRSTCKCVWEAANSYCNFQKE